MANTRAVTNKVIDFRRVLLPVGRRVVEAFSKMCMFSPDVSTKDDNRDLHGKP
jgi:hypothetical protein